MKQVPDFRSAHGRTHPLWLLLLLIVMGMLAGNQGYRPLETFAIYYRQPLCELLGLERLFYFFNHKSIPSYLTPPAAAIQQGLSFPKRITRPLLL